MWDDNNTIVEVAVKTLSVMASMNERIKFLQEAHVMSQFNHSNIVKLLGVVPEGKPVSRRVEHALVSQAHWESCPTYGTGTTSGYVCT